VPIKKVNVSAALDYLELVLGQAWLEENLKLMKDGQCGQGGFGREIDFTALGISYASKIWYKAREEAIHLEIVGGGLPGPYTLAAAALASDLEVLEGCAGLHNKLTELKDAEHSWPNVYALGIAAGYAQNGYAVTFISPKEQDCLAQCAAGVFMANAEGSELMIICADEDNLAKSGAKLWLPRLVRGATPDRRVLYLYGEDILTATETLLHKLVLDHSIPVLVYTVGMQMVNNQPAYVRQGRLVNDNHESWSKDIYIPEEIIIPFS